MSKENFLSAISSAIGADVDELESMEVVETHEPVKNFRPVDVITGKAAGHEYNTPFGVVVERRNMKRFNGDAAHHMYLWRDSNSGVTFVGHYF